jgi:hypothetical protein
VVTSPFSRLRTIPAGSAADRTSHDFLYPYHIGRFKDMTSLVEAESKYGPVVRSAGGQIFGIERAASVGRQEEKLKIGTPDGFVTIDVVLNQPNIEVGREGVLSS